MVILTYKITKILFLKKKQVLSSLNLSQYKARFLEHVKLNKSAHGLELHMLQKSTVSIRQNTKGWFCFLYAQMNIIPIFCISKGQKPIFT